MEEWCSGAGTWKNPYLIKNVTINGQNTTSCVEITCFNLFFLIRNCTFYNAYFNSSIRLSNVNDRSISNCKIGDNSAPGIHIISEPVDSLIA